MVGLPSLLLAIALADPECTVLKDTDINPHTAGLGHTGGSSVDDCCKVCRSPVWWEKGCRFSTFSKGACWLKGDNRSVVASPGKDSVACHSEAPPPPPPPPPPPLPPKGTTGPWKKLGPWNIGDDIDQNGEAGTLADAASPAKNPHIMYAGGQNNGASSGLLKSVDGGRHWTLASEGMFFTRVEGVHVVDDDGMHVLVAVIGGIYESLDGAASWSLVNNSAKFGVCNTFKNGTINGEPHVLVGCAAGVANAPTKDGKAPLGNASWQVIPPGGVQRTYITVADVQADGSTRNSVIGACMGHLWIGTIVNRTYANWTSFPNRPCVMAALNPNNASHFIYTHPPITYQSLDGGKTFENLNHSNIFHCGIDRYGWLYTAAMGGAFFAEPCGGGVTCHWNRYNSVRHWRRVNRTVLRSTHDYQRIALDFGGGVSFPSDQGLFVKPPGNGTMFVTVNGNMSNNIAMKAAISVGEGEGKRYIVTTAWDWAPLASWDSGKHWPSWQPPLDGGSAGCIGEGGGAYAMGRSNKTLVMHKHNIMFSSMGGKNLSRFVMPHGATVFGPSYAKLSGSRSEPNGAVYAPAFFGPMPFNITADKLLTGCVGPAVKFDLGVHASNFSCLAAVDLGVQYGWYKGINAAVWHGESDKHCMVCNISGNATRWNYTAAVGAFSYVYNVVKGNKERDHLLKKLDANHDGKIDAADLAATQDRPPDEKDDDADDFFDYDKKLPQPFDYDDVPDGSLTYCAKSFDYGFGNWTWSLLPPFLQAEHITGFINDPSDGGKVVYGLGQKCITRSLDRGDTWEPCWNATGLNGTFKSLEIKDSTTMLLIRTNDMPIRTKDGGATWHVMSSLAGDVWKYVHTFSYSWSGKTLAMFANGGTPSDLHPHSAYVWKSVDDGDTWTDETDKIVTNGAGISQWYEDTLYLSSGGGGILAKKFE